MISDNINKFIGNAFGISVQNAYPFQTVYLAQFVQQIRQRQFIVQIQSVTGSILRNNDKFLNSFIRKLPRLFYNILNRAASVTSAYLRNSAISTAVVAPIGDTQISVMRHSGQNPLSLHRMFFFFAVTAYLPVCFAVCHFVDYLGDMSVFRNSDNRVNLGIFFLKFIAVTFRKATRYHNILDCSLVFQRYKLVEPLNRFFFRGGNKSAGVQQHNIRKPGFFRERITRVRKSCHHLFRVNLIFRAAERYHGHLKILLFTHINQSS